MADMAQLNALSERVIGLLFRFIVSLGLDYLDLHIEPAFAMNLTRLE